MTQQNSRDGSSIEQKQQAAKNASKSDKSAETQGFDKKLDGPNQPST